MAPALDGRAEITIPEILDVLAIEPERRTVALAMQVGEALRRRGWAPAARRGTGNRERIYRPAPPAPVLRSPPPT